MVSVQPVLPLETSASRHECGPRLTHEQRFERFRAEHPEVERELVRLARQARRRGVRVGMRCLWERLRWHFEIDRIGSFEYKLNNNHAPFYARYPMRTYPDLRGMFATRGDK